MSADQQQFHGPHVAAHDPRAPPQPAASASAPMTDAPVAPAAAPSAAAARARGQLSIALVCRSNVNRSMEAHYMLLQNGYQSVSSFGTGTKVSLAGEGRAPNEFRFGTPYATIAADLRGKNEALYTRTRILGMLDRDAKVKPAPERFQDIAPSQRFDLVVTFEAHVYNAVLDELKKRTAPLLAPCHVVNLETPDTLDDASAAALLTLRLVRAVHDAVDPPTTEADAAAAVLARLSQHLPRPEGAGWRADQTHWEDALPPLLAALEVETKKPVHHAVAWV